MKNNYYLKMEQMKTQSLLSTYTKSLTLLFLLFLGQSVISQSVNYDWAKGIGGTSLDEGSSITHDAMGNIYVTGRFYGTVDFNPGAAINNLTSNGTSDIYVLKLDASGNYIWAKQIGGVGQDKGNAIHVDVAGNIFVTGFFSDTVDFDPGTATSNLISGGIKDIFILKINSLGNFIWAKQIGSDGNDEGYDIVTDSKRDIYLTGNYYNTVDFDPGTGVSNSTSTGLFDVFVLKLNFLGNYVWVKTVGGTNVEQSFSIDVDTASNVFTTGYFNATVDFDPGTGTANLTSNGMRDIYVLKLDASGNYVWAKNIGGGAQDMGKDLVIDNSGDVLITGQFQYLTDFDPGAGTANQTSSGIVDSFILKLDANGNYVWAKQYGGTNLENSESISLDNNENIYTTGNFYGTADFDPGTGTANLTAVGISSDIFVLKLDASGNYIWAGRMGGSSDDIGNSITVDNSCNIYSTGYYFDSVNFDPGVPTDFLVSNGSADLYVQKLSCQTTVGLDNDFIENNISIYPNPTSSQVTISDTDKEISNITIIDITGKVVLSLKPENTEIDLSMLKNGIYFMKIQQGDEFVTKKIIKK